MYPISPAQVAGLTGLATNLLLFKLEYRGDTIILCHALGWSAAFAYLLNTTSWYASLAMSTLMLVVHLATMIGITLLYRVSPVHPLWSYPGPFMNKLTSLTLLKMVYDGKRFEVIKSLHEQYGTFVRTGPNTLSILSHSAFHPIYTTSQSMEKSEAYRQGRAHDGGLFFMRSLTKHNARRKVWGTAFITSSLEHLMKVLEKRTRQMLDLIGTRQSADGVVDMTEVFKYWSFDLMGEMTFGSSSRIELMEEGDPTNLVETTQKGTAAFEIFGEVPALFDLAWNLPAAKDLRVLGNLSAQFVATRKQKFQGDDIASHLLGEHGGVALSDDELTQDATLAISAGSDTTAGTMTFLLFHLLSNPDVYKKLLAELETEYYSADDVTDAKALQQMPYLSGVVYEGLRLGTPLGGMPRVVPAGGALIAGKFVPAGTIVGIPLSTMQVIEENYYPAPEKFLPERWQKNGLGPDMKTTPLMSFSAGAYSCLGKPFALQELHLVLAKMVMAYDMEFAPQFDAAEFVANIKNMRTTIFGRPLLITATPRC